MPYYTLIENFFAVQKSKSYRCRVSFLLSKYGEQNALLTINNVKRKINLFLSFYKLLQANFQRINYTL